MITLFTLLAGWFVAGFFAGLVRLLELRIRDIRMNTRKENRIFKKCYKWGLIALAIALYKLTKEIRKN